jgi:hypothetical protein
MCLFDCLNEPSHAPCDLFEKKRSHVVEDRVIFFFSFFFVINTNDFFNGIITM